MTVQRHGSTKSAGSLGAAAGLLALVALTTSCAGDGTAIESGDARSATGIAGGPSSGPASSPSRGGDSWQQPASYLNDRVPRHGPAAQLTLDPSGNLVLRPGDDAEVPPVRVRLPLRSSQPISLMSSDGPSIDFEMLDTLERAAVVEGDTLAFVASWAANGHVAVRASNRGVEDFVELAAAPDRAQLSYEVVLHDIAGLRLVSNVLEYLDASGTPRLRTGRPWLRDAKGEIRWATLSVIGCRYDDSPLPPWRRSPTAPGADRCTLRLEWDDTGLSYPVLVDPPWTSTTGLAVARAFHTATLLADGKVLIVGGHGLDRKAVAATEMFDPETRTFSMVADLRVARSFHTATLLEEDGSVLVTGGYDAAELPTASVERFLRDRDQWVPEADMPEARAEHAATRLQEDRVVITGGGGLTALTFEPAAIGPVWQIGQAALVPRFGHTASLTGGRILVVGGNTQPQRQGLGLRSVESLEATVGGQWRAEQAVRGEYYGHTATTLSNDDVLVVDEAGTQVFQRYQLAWRDTGGQPAFKRRYHVAALLPSARGDRVVIVGGLAGAIAFQSAEYFVANQERWSESPLELDTGLFGHTATVLHDGATILVAGGCTNFGLTTLDRAEVAQFFVDGTACSTDRDCFNETCVDGICCDRRCDGVCEECGASGRCEPKVAGTLCATSRAACEADAVCDGQSGSCPPAPVLSAGTPCGDAVSPCQAALVCDGTSNACPLPPDNSVSCDARDRCSGDACPDAGSSSTCRGNDCPPLLLSRSAPQSPFRCGIAGDPRSPGQTMAATWLAAVCALLLLRRWPGRATVALSLWTATTASCGDDDLWIGYGGDAGAGGATYSTGGSGAIGGVGGNAGAAGSVDPCVPGIVARWSPVAGPAPSARLLAAAASTSDGPLVYGGVTFLGGALADTWRLGADGWSLLDVDESPPARAGHAMSTARNGAAVLLFGGENDGRSNETWLWNGDVWEALCTGDRLCSTQPSPRTGHAMVYDRRLDRVLLIGGFDGEEPLADTWSWSDANGWTQVCGSCEADADGLDCCGYGPRFGHAVAWDPASGDTLMFGGNDGERDLASLWRLSGSEWTEVRPIGELPGKRAGHGLIRDDATGLILMLGGVAEGATLADGLWAFQPRDERWIEVSSGSLAPPPRAFAPLIAGAQSNEYFLLGGGTTGELDDAWKLTLQPEPPWCGLGGVGGSGGELDAGFSAGEDGGATIGGDAGLAPEDAGLAGAAGAGATDACAQLFACCATLPIETSGRCYAIAESTNEDLCQAELASCR